MRDTYSLYEAKARLSAIVRRVREGHSVTVTVHGKPVAEIRPVAAPEPGIDGRVAELTARGVLVGGAGSTRIRTIARRPGAVARLVRDRDE
jgi:prevent-host-death family protein